MYKQQRTMVCTLNFPDFKDRKGNWVRSFSKDIDKVCYHYTTRAGILWQGINYRCKATKYHEKLSSYAEVTNGFKDFQEFAERCQTQEGYLNKEDNGNYWSLDKDLLYTGGSRKYSPDNCVFLPAEVNTTMGSHKDGAKPEPIGVYLLKHSGQYEAKIGGKNATVYLGRYSNPQEAHCAWQKAKVVMIKDLTHRLNLPIKMKDALLSIAALIDEDIFKGRQTDNLWFILKEKENVSKEV